METAGVLILVIAAWISYCGVKSIRPIATLQAIIQNPGAASSVIEGAETAAKGSAAPFSGGGSFGTAATTPALVSSGAETGASNGAASGGPQEYAQAQLASHGWGQDQWPYLLQLWNKESGWNPSAKNPSSGAYGIPQALPASKMATAGSDYLTNYKTQIDWGLSYIKSAYGSPEQAWAHETADNWY